MILDENYLHSIDILLESTSKSFIDDLKDNIKSKSPDLTGAKNKILKMYATSPDNLARDLPDIGELVRVSITVGIPMAVNPLLGVFVLLADRVVQDAANASVISKYIRSYMTQKERFEKQLEKEKDPKIKKQLQDQIDELGECIDNLDYKRSQLHDKEAGPLNTMLRKANEKNLEESFIILRNELTYLTESEYYSLFNDDILSEGALDNAKMKAKELKQSIDDKKDSMDNWFNDTLKSIRNGTNEQTKDDIVEDNFPKLSKMIKRAIIIGAVWAINPAIAALTAMSMFVLSKRGTASQKKKLLSELKAELEMVEEKIKDADNSTDRQKKYELMRLRQKIQTNIDKIKGYI